MRALSVCLTAFACGPAVFADAEGTGDPPGDDCVVIETACPSGGQWLTCEDRSEPVQLVGGVRYPSSVAERHCRCRVSDIPCASGDEVLECSEFSPPYYFDHQAAASREEVEASCLGLSGCAPLEPGDLVDGDCVAGRGMLVCGSLYYAEGRVFTVGQAYDYCLGGEGVDVQCVGDVSPCEGRSPDQCCCDEDEPLTPYSGCTLSETGCDGTPAPCSSTPPGDCDVQPGCSLLWPR